jgi:hypothetical protein
MTLSVSNVFSLYRIYSLYRMCSLYIEYVLSICLWCTHVGVPFFPLYIMSVISPYM